MHIKCNRYGSAKVRRRIGSLRGGATDSSEPPYALGTELRYSGRT